MSDTKELIGSGKSVNVIPVVETMSADLLTPLAVYLKLSAGNNRSFLLESVEGGEALARYSFVGAGPHTLVSGNDKQVTVRDVSGVTVLDRSILEYLREHFSKYQLSSVEGLPSFAGGAIGSLGFGCSAWFEPALKDKVASNENDVELMFFRTIVAFDHARQQIKIVTLVFVDEANGNETVLEQAIGSANNSNRNIKYILETEPVRVPAISSPEAKSPVESNYSRADFEHSVLEIKEQIASGNAYQVVLSQRFSRQTSATPVGIYRAMRSLNPSPYMFLIEMDSRSIIGASPEMLVKCQDRRLEYRPIAGTRPRGKTKAEDDALADEMRADRKEVAEHLMLVDLGRNDLGRVAEYGSVKVNGLMSVEKYSHVQHLVSYLSADLREGLDRFDALAACFPAGTVSGAPKVRAIEIISEREPTGRGVYSGAVGYFDYSGNMDTCIAIRTMTLENGVACVQAGAGIVADSNPSSEFEETVNKASALLRAIEIAETGQI